jgi:hypothetical protein
MSISGLVWSHGKAGLQAGVNGASIKTGAGMVILQMTIPAPAVYLSTANAAPKASPKVILRLVTKRILRPVGVCVSET